MTHTRGDDSGEKYSSRMSAGGCVRAAAARMAKGSAPESVSDRAVRNDMRQASRLVSPW
ncbi:hypothetical protein [Amycolatopsis japonica]